MGSRLDNQLRDYWADRKRRNRRLAVAGILTLAQQKSRYHLVAPFDEGFNARLRAIGGRWKFRSKCWSVPTSQRTQLRQLITDCFGADKVPQELRD